MPDKAQLYQVEAELAYEQIRNFTWYLYRLGLYSPDKLAHLDKEAEKLLIEALKYIKAHFVSPEINRYMDCKYSDDTPSRLEWFLPRV